MVVIWALDSLRKAQPTIKSDGQKESDKDQRANLLRPRQGHIEKLQPV
jgi:hypothetical protein